MCCWCRWCCWCSCGEDDEEEGAVDPHWRHSTPPRRRTAPSSGRSSLTQPLLAEGTSSPEGQAPSPSSRPLRGRSSQLTVRACSVEAAFVPLVFREGNASAPSPPASPLSSSFESRRRVLPVFGVQQAEVRAELTQELALRQGVRLAVNKVPEGYLEQGHNGEKDPSSHAGFLVWEFSPDHLFIFPQVSYMRADDGAQQRPGALRLQLDVCLQAAHTDALLYLSDITEFELTLFSELARRCARERVKLWVIQLTGVVKDLHSFLSTSCNVAENVFEVIAYHDTSIKTELPSTLFPQTSHQWRGHDMAALLKETLNLPVVNEAKLQEEGDVPLQGGHIECRLPSDSWSGWDLKAATYDSMVRWRCAQDCEMRVDLIAAEGAVIVIVEAPFDIASETCPAHFNVIRVAQWDGTEEQFLVVEVCAPSRGSQPKVFITRIVKLPRSRWVYNSRRSYFTLAEDAPTYWNGQAEKLLISEDHGAQVLH